MLKESKVIYLALGWAFVDSLDCRMLKESKVVCLARVSAFVDLLDFHGG